jgi:hypothetical protein
MVKGYDPGAATGAVRSSAISSVRPPAMGAGVLFHAALQFRLYAKDV